MNWFIAFPSMQVTANSFCLSPCQLQYKELSRTAEVEGCSYIEGVIYGNGGNGNKAEPWGSSGALCTPYYVLLDVTGDILCEGQKQTTQQKRADIDKRRHTGLMIGELREFSDKCHLNIWPSHPTQLGQRMCCFKDCNSATGYPFQSKVWKVKCQVVTTLVP